MLSLFQNEWDAVMLETFSLKQQLETTRQELSQALYQQDAACRVIARLLKERDEARAALMSARQAAAHGGGGAAAQAPVAPAPASSMEEEEEEEGDGTTIPASAVRAMETQAKALVKTRKKRALPAGLPEPEALGQWAETGSHSPHSAARGGITTVAADPRRSDVVVTGGVDHKVKVFSRSEARVLSTMGAHTKRINDIAVHWGRNVVVSASLDKTACVWHAAEGGDDFAKAYSLQHGSEVVAACIQATGEYVVTAEKAGSWSFHALADGRTLCTKEGEGDKYRAARVHPDGLLFATATDSGAVRVWDLKAQAQVASFEDHGKGVNALAFSENGYHLATASDDGHLKLWDLRKQRVVKELDMGAPVHCAAFDTSGTYLAAGAADARCVHASFPLCCAPRLPVPEPHTLAPSPSPPAQRRRRQELGHAVHVHRPQRQGARRCIRRRLLRPRHHGQRQDPALLRRPVGIAPRQRPSTLIAAALTERRDAAWTHVPGTAQSHGEMLLRSPLFVFSAAHATPALGGWTMSSPSLRPRYRP